MKKSASRLKSDKNLILFEKGNKIGKLGGRPKGSQSFSTILNKMLDTKFHKLVVNPVDGKPGTFTAREVMLMGLLHEAINGNVKAVEKIMDRIEGKPVQKIETHENNQEQWVALMNEIENKDNGKIS